ncbi:MAG: hypothetical protein ACI4V7_04825 [Succinivibrionaceae bacterium]
MSYIDLNKSDTDNNNTIVDDLGKNIKTSNSLDEYEDKYFKRLNDLNSSDNSESKDDEELNHHFSDNHMEQIGSLLLRYTIVIVLAIIIYLIILTLNSIELKSILSILAIIIIYYIPRILYSRYKKVVINEEIRINYTPQGFFQRTIYPLRTTLVPYSIFILSSFILFDTLVTQSVSGLTVIVVSLISYIIINTSLRTSFFNNFFNAEKIPSIYTFYRNWISILITGIISFIFTFLFIEPTLNQYEAINVLGNNISSNLNAHYGNFYLFIESINILMSIHNYCLSLLSNTPYYYVGKALLISLPYTIFSIHLCLAFSLLTLPKATLKNILKKQNWIKTNKNIFLKHWKNICLPLFMFGFFTTIYHFGYPYYEKYQEKLIMQQTTVQKANSELIGDKYYSLGTLNKINKLKDKAISDINNLFTSAVNEVNNSFSDTIESGKHFVIWFDQRTQKYPFNFGDKQLYQSYISALKVKSLTINISNIRKDLGSDVAKIISSLNNDILELLHKNELNGDNASNYISDACENYDMLFLLQLSPKKLIDISEIFRLKVPLLNIEKELTNDINNPNSPWYNYIYSEKYSNKKTDETSKEPISEQEAYLLGEDISSKVNEHEEQIETFDEQPTIYNAPQLDNYLTDYIEKVRDNIIRNLAIAIDLDPNIQNIIDPKAIKQISMVNTEESEPATVNKEQSMIQPQD